MSARRIVPLLLGTQVLDRCIALGGPVSGVRDRIPIPAFLVELDDGRNLLWDCGFDHAILDEPGMFSDVFPPPDTGPEDTLVARLERAGTGVDGIDLVAVSHLMSDHAGGLRSLDGRDVVVQAAELEYAMGEPDADIYRRADYDAPGVRVAWRPVSGDVVIHPGVTVLSTPGHCAGHQSLLVRLESGRTVLIASDAGDLRENFDGEVAPGIVLAGRDAALASIRRLKSVADAHDALLVPGHDPVAWAALPGVIV